LLLFSALETGCGSGKNESAQSGGSKKTGGAKQSGGDTAPAAGGSNTGGTGTGGTISGGTTTVTSGGSTSGGTIAGGSASGGAQTGGATISGGSVSTSGGASTGGNSVQGGASATGGSTGGASGTGGTPVVITPAEGDQWVSATGDDSNPGTEAKPLKNLQTAVLKAQPGTTIWMMAGTHSYASRVGIKSEKVNLTMGTRDPTAPAVANARDGQEGKLIHIFGVAGSRPVIDFGPQRKIINDMAASECAGGPSGSAAAIATRNSSRGIALYAEYWHLKNLEITGAADNCIYVAGSHNIVENVAIHDCGDTGLQITGQDESTVYLPSYNKIINCDSYQNIDDLICEELPGEDADGYAAKLAIGPGNEFRGCRAWNNVDDGWDFFAGKLAQPPVLMDNCWAFGMNHPGGNDRSDGNGFKLGGWRNEPDQCVASLNSAKHILTNLFAFDNPGKGYSTNGNSAELVCDKCGGWNNGCKSNPKCNKNFYVKETSCGNQVVKVTNEVTGLTVTSEKAKNAKRDASGNLPDIRSL
jgi:hypothetical protein